MKITLGTVQFGMNYGITNVEGQTSFEQVEEILSLAQLNGIMILDTAPSYGNAERTLGKLNLKGFSIITKTPHFTDNVITEEDIQQLNKTFEQSLEDLNVAQVEGLLIHNVRDCYKKNSQLLFDALTKLKEAGKVKKIGVSIYEPKDIELILQHDLPVDIIQMPLNVLDQRMLQNNYLAKIKARQIEIHIRSIFLQGILIGDEATIPPTRYKYVENYFNELPKYNLTKLEAALLFIQQINEVDNVLLGVNNKAQLEEIIRALERLKIINHSIDFTCYACDDETMIDPRKW